MTELRVLIPGEPHGQARQRHRLVRTNAGKTFVHNYQPSESRNWKATAQAHMRVALGDSAPFDGPVSLEITAYFTCPRSSWRKGSPRPEAWCTKKPDFDNVAKAIADSGNGVLWFDDAQLAEVTVRKIIAAQGEPPRVELVASALVPRAATVGATLALPGLGRLREPMEAAPRTEAHGGGR